MTRNYQELRLEASEAPDAIRKPRGLLALQGGHRATVVGDDDGPVLMRRVLECPVVDAGWCGACSSEHSKRLIVDEVDVV